MLLDYYACCISLISCLTSFFTCCISLHLFKKKFSAGCGNCTFSFHVRHFFTQGMTSDKFGSNFQSCHINPAEGKTASF